MDNEKVDLLKRRNVKRFVHTKGANISPEAIDEMEKKVINNLDESAKRCLLEKRVNIKPHHI